MARGRSLPQHPDRDRARSPGGRDDVWRRRTRPSYRVRPRRRQRRLQRGVYLIPSLFTIANIFCGFLAILRSSEGQVATAAMLIVIAAVLDGLDGRIARMTRSSSEFGVQLDSLADVVSFGVAPAILAFAWTLSGLGRLGWLISFGFLACAAVRLARFNIQGSSIDKRYFVGLPSPVAAGVISTCVFAFPAPSSEPLQGTLAAIVVGGVSVLMVSRFRFRSFKDFDLAGRQPARYVLWLALGVAAVATFPEIAMGGFLLAYLLSGLLPKAAPLEVARGWLPGGRTGEPAEGEGHGPR